MQPLWNLDVILVGDLAKLYVVRGAEPLLEIAPARTADCKQTKGLTLLETSIIESR